ncbi:MAG: hypothetical protein K2O10_07520 [Muribaculaceae bacterium]|nr:hypothetical protein [Muribaculaceae bacterium]
MTHRNCFSRPSPRLQDTLVYLASMALAVILGIMIVTACTDNDNDWDQAPRAVKEFVAEYFPGQTISDISHQGDVVYVRLRNSAAINFRQSDYKWISVNGYGQPLPAQFLFDCLPPALYEHLQATSSLGEVYRVSRDKDSYTVALLDYTINFDTETSQIKIIT